MALFNILVLFGCFLVGCASQVDVDSVASLRGTQEILDQAEDEGAEKFAPASYKQAVSELDKAAKILHDEPNSEVANRWVESASFAAKRSLMLTRESKAIAELEPEQIALKQESMLVQIAEPLELSEMRDQSFSSQTEVLKEAVAEKNKQSLKAGELMGAKEKSDRELSALKTQKQFNERLERVSDTFDENEAEVYRKGSAVVVRLKSLEFPSGQAVVPNGKFPLLNKLQKAVSSFRNPTVVIEGHTDSTGSPEKNKELSLERANAVRDYLAANTGLGDEKLKTIGYGSESPIASNQSTEGRKQNRRVDVIIQTATAE